MEEAVSAMRIYIAGSWNQKDALNDIAQQVRVLDHIVTSTWLTEEGVEHEEWVKGTRSIALRDLVDIQKADVVIVDVTVPSSTGGYHFEAGYATGLGWPIWIVGEAGNGFLWLANKHFADWGECLDALRRPA